MKALHIAAILFGIIGSIFPTTLFGQENAAEKQILQVNLRKAVNSVSWMEVGQGLKHAAANHYDAVLINMNTYGGEVVYADSIRTAILNAPMPVYVFINNNAASAGALISLACDKIFMRTSATIGASTVVDQTGAAAPDKYQSYMRGIIRATAQAQGKDTLIENGDTILKWKRNPAIAEAMVDPDIYIAGVIDSGKVLTFTALEALENGFCDGISENINELMVDQVGFKEYKIDVYVLKGWDWIRGQLLSTAFRAILIILIIGGIWFELQAPGIGFPTVVAVVSAVFYFAPLYMDGLAQNWEIILFVLGFVLLFFEVFVIPGFGVAGISGILFMIIGMTAALIDNSTFQFKLSGLSVLNGPLLLVSLSILIGVGLSLWLTTRIGMRSSFMKFAALTTEQNRKDGYLGVPMELLNMNGKIGIAETMLRPSGKVRIDDKMYDAMCEYGFIEMGESIRVIRSEAGQIYVVKAS